MRTVTEVEAALERFSPEQMREVSDWIACGCPTDSPEMPAAIEPKLSAEEVRRNTRSQIL